jgi:hypothetical protein
MGYRAEHLQTQNFQIEEQVFTNLEKSSDATAKALTAEQGTMEGMNTALQKQLALYYEISIIPIWDGATKKIAFANTGRTNVSVWGGNFNNSPMEINEEARTIAPSGSYTIDAQGLYDKILEIVPKGSNQLLSLDIYVRNDRGEEFVEHCYVGTLWKDDTLNLTTQVVSVEPEKWSKGQKKVPPASAKAP